MKELNKEIQLENFSNLLSDKLEHVPNINRGGCGFSALYIKESLEQIGFKANIVVVGCYQPWTGKPYFNESREFLNRNKLIEEGLEMTATGFNLHFGANISHVVVEVDINGKLFYIDSTGVYQKANECGYYFTHCSIVCSLTSENLKELLSCELSWNNAYNREYNTIIEESCRNVATISA